MREEVLIRPAEKEDIGLVAQFEQQIFSEPWSQQNLEDARERQENIFLVATCDDTVAAYALCYGTMDEGEIPTIATNPEFMHRGIGTDFLKCMLQECNKRGIKRVFLEVRVSNRKAQGLYHKCGFEVVGKRKDFYRFPTEDALVMRCQVQPQQ